MNKSSKSTLITIAVFIFGVVVTYILFIARPTAKAVPAKNYRPFVRIQQVFPQDKHIFIEARGTVVPRTQSMVVSQVSGQITHVSSHFVPGGFFKKGQVMLSVDTTDYVLARARARLSVAQAKLALAREEQEARIARAEWDKMGEGTADALVLHKPQLEQARAALNAAMAGLKQSELDIKRTRIRAPYFCRVRSKQVDEGQVINRGAPLATVYAVDYAEIRLPLPDNDLAFINVPGNGINNLTGPPVEIHATFAGKNYKWDGKLVRMEGEIDQRSRMAHVVVRVKNPYGNGRQQKPPLAVGMFVNAKISGRIFKNIYEINRSAFRNGNQLLIVDDAQKLHFRTVHILRQNTQTALVDSGLTSGEKVCITPLDVVVEGMAIRASPTEKQTGSGN